MTTTEKMARLTNKAALLAAIDALNGKAVTTFAAPDVVEKLEKMVEQLEKKNASPKKMTKTQEANAANIEVVIGFLAEHEGEGFTCADLIKNVDVLEGKSNQYVSAIMKIAVDGGRVEKYTDKRRTYFRIK